jgi:hypothetical protein
MNKMLEKVPKKEKKDPKEETLTSITSHGLTFLSVEHAKINPFLLTCK